LLEPELFNGYWRQAAGWTVEILGRNSDKGEMFLFLAKVSRPSLLAILSPIRCMPVNLSIASVKRPKRESSVEVRIA
jgi:hypothetical protein